MLLSAENEKSITIEEAMKSLGHVTWRPHQSLAINESLKGKDGVVIVATGGGKSSIFQSLALTKPGMSLVISPLIALMGDQVRSLKEKGIAAEFLNSSLSPGEAAKVEVRVLTNKVKILYVSPERLQMESFQSLISSAKIAYVFVDEAHCSLQWGFDFRPEYTKIGEFVKSREGVQVVAFTATAGPKDQDGIASSLNMHDGYFKVVTSCDRKNLSYHVHHTDINYRSAKRAARALRMIERYSTGPGILYVSTRKDADNMDFILKSNGVFCRNRTIIKYHAGMTMSERKRASTLFSESINPFVVSTNAFGMGIDRPDIRQVFHFQSPGSIEAYYQEVGRAGRDGNPCEAHMLFNEKDRGLQEFFIHSEAWPEEEYFDLAQRIEKCHAINPKEDAGVYHMQRKGLVRHLEKLKWKLNVPSKDLKSDDRWKELVSWSTAYIDSRVKMLDAMQEYTREEGCRRKFLVNYFGQTPDKNSNCCDNCL